MAQEMDILEKIQSLAKRRGFIYQGSEIYGGLAGTWDYGPLGVALKNNIKDSWRKKFVSSQTNMFEVDAAILMNPKVWESSGHVATFADPMVECLICKKRFRADQAEVLEEHIAEHAKKDKASVAQNIFSEPRQFNMMFATRIGAVEDSSATVYLRPETAAGMFVNFKNIVDSFHPKLPFGLAQIGKAFRNEITPRDFIFRVREFEQMEIEYFVKPEDWEKYFEFLKDEMTDWMGTIGLDMNKVHELNVAPEDLAHYSKRTVDFEFDFPFGRKELYGLAYRTNFDLTSHSNGSSVDLSYQDEEGQPKILPHVLEPSFGVDRTVLALLTSAYAEDGEGDAVRSFLKFKPSMAPVICAVSPLLKNKPALVEKAQHVFGMLKAEFGRVMFDDNGNIGKRYRRQDEIGTPWCIVVDFDTLGEENPDNKDTVTVRDRDTGAQSRMKIQDLVGFIRNGIS